MHTDNIKESKMAEAETTIVDADPVPQPVVTPKRHCVTDSVKRKKSFQHQGTFGLETSIGFAIERTCD